MPMMADQAAMEAYDAQKGDRLKGCVIQFYRSALQDSEKSAMEGRPIFRDCDMIRIFTPGDPTNIIEREVRSEDSDNWPKEWANYKKGLDAPAEGTPLDQLPFLTKGQVLELNAAHVRTAEQFMEIADGNLSKFMGGQTIKRKVKAFLEAAAGAAPALKLAAELEKRDNEIKTLQNALADQGKKIQELQTQKR